MLTEYDSLPDGLLALEAHQLASVLQGPTLIHLQGRREPALFISVLMHGNETVGWDAIRRLLSQQQAPLPRSISLFISNPIAAAQGVRRLETQPDYNRVWPGTEIADCPEVRTMTQVTERMVARSLFASIDIHNNTGHNPHYACVNRLDNRFLHLATLFSRTVVYFLRPKGVQSLAMAEYCPSVTLECGRVGQVHGIEHAQQFLHACLHLAEHPTHTVAPHDIDLFHTVAQVQIPAEIRFGFDQPDLPLNFPSDLDQLNFRELPAGTLFGWISELKQSPLKAIDEQGSNISERFFMLEEQEIRLRVAVMPSMLTTNVQVIRQDCLCYLMERYNHHVPVKPQT